jgi:hypothetical protein
VTCGFKVTLVFKELAAQSELPLASLGSYALFGFQSPAYLGVSPRIHKLHY